MTKLNENEAKALDAIIATCDDLDGDLFTRMDAVAFALIELFKDGHVAGGYIIDLEKKGYLDFEEPDPMYSTGIWVNAEQ